MAKKYKIEKSIESSKVDIKTLAENPIIKKTTDNLIENVLKEQLGIQSKDTKAYKQMKEQIRKKVMKHPSYKKIMLKILDIFKDF